MEKGSRISLYLLFVFGVAVLALAGYAGYALYPRFHLPAVSGAGLLLLAAAAGIASFFSPCSFSLLVTLLARGTGAGKRRPVATVLGFALALSAGSGVFLLLTGLAIAAGGGVLFAGVTFTSTAGRVLRLGAGIFLVVLGLAQSGVFRLPLFGRIKAAALPIERAQARLGGRHAAAGFFLFGFGYVLAGFG